MARIKGQVTTSAATAAAIESTTYTEQSSGAQRSFKSSSANDTAAGTGARKVKLTYYALASGAVSGPKTETVTLNGVTAVATVATDIALIEKIEVITAGSGGVPAGTISLYTDNAGAGSVFASIATGARSTKFAHHYVPTGNTWSLTDLMMESTAGADQLPMFEVRSLDYSVSDAAEQSLAEFTIAGSQGSKPFLPPPIPVSSPLPIKVVGPARVRFYVTPTDTASQVSKVNVGYTE